MKTHLHTAPDREIAEREGQLLRSLAGKYDLFLDAVDVGGRSFSMYRVRNTNALIDALSADDLSDDDRFPYWAQLWESSVALADWCLSTPMLSGANVLELGCGLGLPGIAAAAVGATVTMTDFDADALCCAQLNVIRNLSPIQQSRVKVGILDWRSSERLIPYDVVLGADIVYERRMFRPLLEQLHAAVRSRGRIILADPDRSVGRAFFHMAEEDGFTVRFIERAGARRSTASRILLAELEEKR
jgi:predicted nicotinamide N-methyase